ncbi:MAG: putative multidrug export ATP-binding/permease protein [Candidatus Heimdallarchaeota archaeon LC_2]|nr:MAG: putative multidrug export ATP-binding/permease protein [Candidatus Heimdallarchaeota archaeon LC_2]
MREVFDLLWPYTKKHKLKFWALNLSIFVAAISQTLIPFQISRLIDGPLQDGNKSGLYSGFAIIVFLGIVDLLAGMGQRFASVKFSTSVIYDIRQDLYQTLQYQELEYYSSETIGQIMSRSIEEVLSLREILTWGYRIALLLVLLFLNSFIVMVGISPKLSIVFLLIPVILFYIAFSTSKGNVKLFYDARFKYGTMNEVLAENLSGIKTVKSFGREEEQIAIFNVKNQDFFDASLKTAKIRANLQSGMVFIISIAMMILVIVGGVFVSNGEITTGQFVAFMLLVLTISMPGRFAGWLGIILQNSQSAALRLAEIFDAPELLEEKYDAIELSDIEGRIRFDNVFFKYPNIQTNDVPDALHHVSFEIPSGQKVALLGPTGSGKTSLINILPRFYDPKEGSVYIDDIDIKSVTTRSLRKNIGIVHQEAFLFTLTIHDNIAFGNSTATRDEVIDVAKSAQIHDFINGLDEGYDTIVGERGVTLSGGQRQRITIARTLLQNPKILIFDDSVSAVDPETEARIQESLESASTLRTTIIISQRPSSLKFVDRIIVLDNGHVVQDGTHENLIGEEGMYKEFLNAVETQIKFLSWDDEGEELKLEDGN